MDQGLDIGRPFTAKRGRRICRRGVAPRRESAVGDRFRQGLVFVGEVVKTLIEASRVFSGQVWDHNHSFFL